MGLIILFVFPEQTLFSSVVSPEVSIFVMSFCIQFSSDFLPPPLLRKIMGQLCKTF